MTQGEKAPALAREHRARRPLVRIVNAWACYPRACQVIQCVQFKLASDVGDI